MILAESRPGSYELPVGEHETPFTVESLKRKRQADLDTYKKLGRFDDKAAAAAVMKPSDPRKNYLMRRLTVILDSRPREEAERIRN